MSNRNDFNNGFLLGSLIGGVVGGVIGTIVANRANRLTSEFDETFSDSKDVDLPRKKPNRQVRNSDRLEIARQSLDDKILDLDRAIDAVRSSLSSVADPSHAINPTHRPEVTPPDLDA
jgi:hypothetical protein